MTDDQAVLSVTSKLTGEFFVGQRVVINTAGTGLEHWDGFIGTVAIIYRDYTTSNKKSLLSIDFDDGRKARFNACWVRPL